MTSYLAEGAMGDEVTDLQGRLVFLGYHRGPIDGYFDTGLVQAVEEWQRQSGLTATGRIDEHELRTLHEHTDPSGYSLAHAQSGAYASHYDARQAELGQVHVARLAEAADPHHANPVIEQLEHHQATYQAPHELHGDRLHWERLARSLHDLSGRVLTVTALHGSAVQRAVSSFEIDIAQPRLDRLSREPTGEDYFKYMARHFGEEAGKWVTATVCVGSAVLTNLWIPLSMQLVRAVANVIHDDLSRTDKLSRALRRMESKLAGELAAAQEQVRRDLDHHLEPIFERINHQQHLDPADEPWVMAVYSASPQGLDAVIEHELGLRTSAADTESAFKARMIDAFDQMESALSF